MGILEGERLLHWNYFLALESDIENLARYIEFTEDNYKTYSTELTNILLACCSEVDVLSKLICQIKNSNSKAGNIIGYRSELRENYPFLESMEITIPRYSLALTPWDNWKNNTSPLWWSCHNNVKHERSSYYYEANLKNTLNAAAGLFCLVLIYHKEKGIHRIEPPSTLFTPPVEYARVCPSVGGRMALFYEENE
ncbi:hypothetical protein [Cobetia sp. MB87]|uniref:hypothetical protein n=1 Tax=Cobetia sp. MB87 TaxID=2588451 RepID=UPI00140A0C2E|nr:hypothetical protein [Cobetia sp. MB87]NHH86778.1 hypothetical protein [Cobetia sp. MB87]